jgi:multiple sugar transport system ATP-binding protein
MASVTFENAERLYPGSDSPAVDDFNLEIEDGEFMVLVGPSGCGKSTSLRMLAGLEEVTNGKIYIGDRDITNLPPKDRDIAMVFQNYALYPHMSVADNMAFSLKALSGGQRQRVAMGRAIVRHPQVFCMDEPLSNLDAKLRVSTRTQIAALQQRLGITTVYVTHDQVEAMTMGDRVAVMKDGLLQQVDSPLNLYDHPNNLFVAGFIGSPAMNLVDAKAGEGAAKIGEYEVPVDRGASSKMKGAITVGVRPEAWRIVSKDEGGLPVKVTVVEELGADAYVYGTSGVEGITSDIVVRIDARRDLSKGDTIYVTTDPDNVHVFETETGKRLSD